MCGRIKLTPTNFGLDAAPIIEAGGVAIVETNVPHRTKLEHIPMSWGFTLRQDRVINARWETLTERPLFATSYAARRGVVYADGWWERGRFVHRKDGASIALAVLWRMEAGTLQFVLVTREAEGAVARIHNRMPVLVDSVGWRHTGTSNPLLHQALTY